VFIVGYEKPFSFGKGFSVLFKRNFFIVYAFQVFYHSLILSFRCMSLQADFQILLGDKLRLNPQPEAVFAQAARWLFDRLWLKCNTQYYYFTELEFYYHSPKHPDPYVHCANRQLLMGEWYFHRFGKAGTVKEGTWKGLDITFGHQKPEPAFGGILIRGIRPMASDKFISGPCKVVNRLLADWQYEKAKELAAKAERTVFENDWLSLEEKPYEERPFYSSTRIGLSDPKEDPLRKTFKDKLYRFVAEVSPAHSFPQKERLVWTAYRQGQLKAEELKKLLGYQPNLEKMHRKYETK
jgi:hypothetical protein